MTALAKTNATATEAQSRASRPTASVWVAANAGTGKTHVLTMRVLRLLLAGTLPERILCLTYTKAAAAEMSKRVFDQLASWVLAPEKDLKTKLGALLGSPPEDGTTGFARTLFARAIETPGGLKIQTIHAFAERLLQRFPFEAGVPAGFKIIEDVEVQDLKARAIGAALRDAVAKPKSTSGKALIVMNRYITDQNFEDLLADMVENRRWLDRASRFNLGKAADDYAGVEAYLRQQFGVSGKQHADEAEAVCAAVLSDGDLSALIALLGSGGKTDSKAAEKLVSARGAATASSKIQHLADFFISNHGGKDEGPRKSLMTKALQDQRRDLFEAATAAQQDFVRRYRDLRVLWLIEATTSLYRLAGAVLQNYRNAKETAGTLDFDDLIIKTMELLSGGKSPWVLFKLDGGLDHILVDEAQDTSPAQWAIIEALANEFYSGAGARDIVRTVFAVGDEKQSIYSFQGAEPKMFDEAGKAFAKKALSAKLDWHTVPLNVSFRSVQTILDAVDAVFKNPDRTPGLGPQSGPIRHIANRLGHAGQIEIWPVEKPVKTEPSDTWNPIGDAKPAAPAARLAARIAGTIRGWLDNGEILKSEGRPVRAADILILVRKRHPFLVPMVSALKVLNIPVAGADQLDLLAQIAVQDLLAIGDFVTTPEDDLALACVLKGPLCGLDDNDLMAFALGRKGSLWKAFLATADANPRYRAIAAELKRWRAKADFLPPFEFFSMLLDRDGGRSRMLHRLGPEAADPIDAFLDHALIHDDRAPPSLTGFLAGVRSAPRTIKRESDLARNEVRVMTVHGAKGLEAPIVFLPDTCTVSSGSNRAARLLELDDDPLTEKDAKPLIWQVKGSAHLDLVQDAQHDEARKDAEERHRLLYVAMTRARDRLYVAGYENSRGRENGCWYDLICNGVGVDPDAADFSGWSSTSDQTAPPDKPKKAIETAAASVALPDFALRRAPSEPALSIPLAPSRFEPYEADAEGEPVVAPPSSHNRTLDSSEQTSPSVSTGDPNRFLRGTLTHALLEHLPRLPKETRRKAAENFLAQRGSALARPVRASIMAEVFRVFSDPAFERLFGAEARAEVPLAANIPRPHGKGPALKLSGFIDRLAVTDDHVLIVDYKTNRVPPPDAGSTPAAYLYQMAAYVLALEQIYGQKPVRAALLWTSEPRLMELPPSLLAQYRQKLWTLETTSLDAF